MNSEIQQKISNLVAIHQSNGLSVDAFSGTEERRISDAESKYNLQLPADYKQFLQIIGEPPEFPLLAVFTLLRFEECEHLFKSWEYEALDSLDIHREFIGSDECYFWPLIKISDKSILFLIWKDPANYKIAALSFGNPLLIAFNSIGELLSTIESALLAGVFRPIDDSHFAIDWKQFNAIGKNLNISEEASYWRSNNE